MIWSLRTVRRWKVVCAKNICNNVATFLTILALRRGVRAATLGARSVLKYVANLR